MTRKEYRMLRVIYRSGSLQRLGEFLRERKVDDRPRTTEQVTQQWLRVVEVDCEAVDAVGMPITLAECIKRQSAGTASGRGKGYPVHEGCKACRWREVHRAMSSAFTPPPYRPFNVSRESKQRAARQRLWRSGALDRVPSMDEPPGDEG